MILREDAEALDAAALLLEMLLAAGTEDFADLERIRQIAEYDELLPRLAVARQRLDSRSQLSVFAAEAALLRIVHGPMSLQDLDALRQTVAERLFRLLELIVVL